MSKGSRFATISEQTLEELVQNRTPQNTKKNTNWALKVWNSCAHQRNIQKLPISADLPKVPLHREFANYTDEELAKFLARFVHEARKQDGHEYSRYSLEQLVCGIQRYLKENVRPEINIIESPVYSAFQKAYDAKLRQLTRDGIGIHQKQADKITEEHEKKLWESGELDLDSSVGLLKATFFYVSKAFGLRSGDEHRGLEVQMFEFGEDSVGRRYVDFKGRSSKTYHGGLGQSCKKPKSIRHYDNAQNPLSVYKILSTYLRYVPAQGPLYRKPMAPTHDEPIRFSGQVVGAHALSNIVRVVMSNAGIGGYFTNHSLKRTCASQLFDYFDDPVMITQRTGHSSSAVEKYKVIPVEKNVFASHVLDPPMMQPTPHISSSAAYSATQTQQKHFVKFSPKSYAPQHLTSTPEPPHTSLSKQPRLLFHSPDANANPTQEKRFKFSTNTSSPKPGQNLPWQGFHTAPHTATQQQEKCFTLPSKTPPPTPSSAPMNKQVSLQEEKEIETLMSDKQFWDMTLSWDDVSTEPDNDQPPIIPTPMPSSSSTNISSAMSSITRPTTSTTTSTPCPTVAQRATHKQVSTVTVSLPDNGDLKLDISMPENSTITISDAKLFPMENEHIVIITLRK